MNNRTALISPLTRASLFLPYLKGMGFPRKALVILGAMEKLFGNKLPEKSFESLKDNGSAYLVQKPADA
ncbi:hypothetical protein [Rahnella victoriana]|uniref:Uncharacterized protein n=1 Tax=Rahnella victoriana TaxID=1510570 RepID=A0ABS0DY56_9GAMM|nr:hypothetical protein [Rahnella victoriana]MBF7958769.1 hypothetical protein [Rahnella victoriana]